MRNVFIDCGFYKGGGLFQFLRSVDFDPSDESFEIYAFDPTPRVNISKENFITNFYKKAAWTRTGTIEFNTTNRRGGKVNSVYHRFLGKTNVIQVSCIDFDKWIREKFAKEDNIIIKMDIEGAEHELLEQMYKNGSISYINILYLEKHSLGSDKDLVLDELLKNIKVNNPTLALRGKIENIHSKYIARTLEETREVKKILAARFSRKNNS